jgi:hypothetical protein
MPIVNLPLTTSIKQRTNDVDKDAKMVNCYKETMPGGATMAVKRPGKATYTVTPALPIDGNGLWPFNNNLYAAAGTGLYRITGGTSVNVNTGMSGQNVSWVNTLATTAPRPYMVFHDQVTGYSMNSTGTVVVINKQVAGITLVSGGSGYTSLTGTFTITGSISGSGAAGTYISDGATITSVTLTANGSNYAGTLTTVFSGAGSGAVATAFLNSFPTSPVPGLVYLDGYVFAMNPQGQIFQSDAENPNVWGPLNYTSAVSEADKGKALARHLNYVIAFKEWTADFFYDAGNTAGSVLSINQSAHIEVGCADGNSIQNPEQTLIWMGTVVEGGRGIYMLDGLSPQKVSTKAVENFLNASDLSGTYSWLYKIAGHTFYGLVLTDQNVTIVYDINEKEWHYWTTSKDYIGGGEAYFECSFVVQFPFNSGIFYVLDAVNGLVFTLSPNNYVDPFGPIRMRIVTDRMDFDTYSFKTGNGLTLFGDNINDVMQVRHTEDDYVNWSQYRQVQLNLQKPCLYQLGRFRRRAYEYLYRGNNPLRLEKVEFNLNGRLDLKQE